jgi:hypothetical protein
MNRKEWREVGRQSLYFILALAAMALLMMGIDLLIGVMGFAQAKPLEGEKLIIILGAWLLMFSMFLGLSPFAMDSKQKGMEYLLTLPLSRRRLLLSKLLPRLAAIVIFYLAFVLLYAQIGNDALGGSYTLFSLAYFALFFISFSLALVHENFIVQSIWAGLALSGYLALCFYVVGLGFSWKFRMPGSWAVSRSWQDLAYDGPTLLAVIAVFLLLAAPFVVSLFIAFKKFDLKPAQAFNRRQLLIFVPLLILAFAASLGVTYLAQKDSIQQNGGLLVLKNGRVLKTEFSGELILSDEHGRRRIVIRRPISWENPLLEEKSRLFLSGYDFKDGSRFIAQFELSSFSWKLLYNCRERFFVSAPFSTFIYDGDGFVYLERSQAEAERPGISSSSPVKTSELRLVRLDTNGAVLSKITYQSPIFRGYYQPSVIGSGRMDGRRFWLIAQQFHRVLRIWDGGRVDDLGVSRGKSLFCRDLLFTIGEKNVLQVRRLTAAGSETMQEFPGDFKLAWSPFSINCSNQVEEIYAVRDRRIVHIELSNLVVTDVGPLHGHVHMVSPGDFYYIEFENFPGIPSDTWRKLHRLQGGKMIFLKKFDFKDAGYGYIEVGSNGVVLHQNKFVKNERKISTKAFAFPDLRELKYIIE